MEIQILTIPTFSGSQLALSRQWGAIIAKSIYTLYSYTISFPNEALKVFASYGGESDTVFSGAIGLVARLYSATHFRSAIWGANGKEYINWWAIGY